MTGHRIRTWVLDLDGVVWSGCVAVPGSVQAIAELRRRGDHVLFVTNHSAPTRVQMLNRLADMGIEASPGELVTSADAAASLLAAGDYVHAFAGDGVVDAIQRRGAHLVVDDPADAVVIGWHAHLDLAGLTRAVRAVLGGARLIATNADPLRPADDGLVPGAGAFVAAVEAATGTRAAIAGKPHDPMIALLEPRLQGEVIVVGDSQRTDGALADALGVSFGLVLTGVTLEPPTTLSTGAIVATDLASLVAAVPPR